MQIKAQELTLGRLLRKLCQTCATVFIAAGTTSIGRADLIDFEGFTQGTVITNQYQSQGVLFNSPTILTSPNYNYTIYPPHPGTSVITNDTGAGSTGVTYIEVDAVAGFSLSTAGAWVTNGVGTTYALDAYDSNGMLIASANMLGNSGSTEFVSVSAAKIAYVRFFGTTNALALDDFTYTLTPNSVPEPSGLLLLGIGGMACGGTLASMR